MNELHKRFRLAKQWIDANVHDGEDRQGCKNDYAKFTPDELQELIDDVIEYLYEELN